MVDYFYIYIMTNQHDTVLYTGVTNDLRRRVSEHKAKIADGFTRRYNISKLVYHETFRDPISAIAREKQIKNYSRKRKDALIESINPDWNDLPI